MKTIKTLVVYDNGAPLTFEPPKDVIITRANPQFWNGVPRPLHDAVYAPQHPFIEEAHKKAGKVVWRPEEEAVEAPQEPTGGFKGVGEVVVGEPSKEELQELVDGQKSVPAELAMEESFTNEWRSLSWPKMRSMATEYTEEPIKSKAQAQEVLEQAEKDGKL